MNRIGIDLYRRLGTVDPRIFGQFIEHLASDFNIEISLDKERDAFQKRSEWAAARTPTSSPVVAGIVFTGSGTARPRYVGVVVIVIVRVDAFEFFT